MWFAHHFPGLAIDADALSAMTPEETQALERAGRKVLSAEDDRQFAHTRVIAISAGGRIR